MEPFDKLKGKLREESPLPEGFGWEEMQEGIFEKMDSSLYPEKKDKRKKLIFFLFGMVVMFVLTVFFYWFRYPSTEGFPKKEIITDNAQPMIEINTTERAVNNTTNRATDGLNPTSNLANPLPTKQSNHPIEKTNELPVKKETQKLITTQLSTSKIQKEVTSIIASEQKGTQGFDQQTKEEEFLDTPQTDGTTNGFLDNQKTNISPNIGKVGNEFIIAPPTAFNNSTTPAETANSTNFNRTNKDVLALNFLHKQSIKALSYQRSSTIQSLSLVGEPLVMEKWEKMARFSVAIGAGSNYWIPNWGDSVASQERAKYEKALWGNTYSFALGYQLKRNWNISSGIIWSKQYSKFDYQNISNYQKEIKAALVEIQVNAVTGDSTQILGDRMINVEQTRTIVHYNTFKKWSIPLSIKYSLRNRKMEYAFGLGTMLTLTTKSAGRTINPDLTDYNPTNSIYKSDMAVSAMGTFDLNYHFTKDYFIGVQLSAVKHLVDWSQTTDVVLKPLNIHSQIMIGRKF